MNLPLPPGAHASLLSAAFALLTEAGTLPGEGCPDLMHPVCDDHRLPAPAGFAYACTYPIMDDQSPGVIHAYVQIGGTQRIFVPHDDTPGGPDPRPTQLEGF